MSRPAHLPLSFVFLLACDGRGWTSANPVTAQSPAARLIALYDVDQNGTLDQAEYSRHAETEADFLLADADRNGAVDEPEMRAHLWTVQTGSRGQGGGRDVRADRGERRGGGRGGEGRGRREKKRRGRQ